jgi:hypothetical protein
MAPISRMKIPGGGTFGAFLKDCVIITVMVVRA